MPLCPLGARTSNAGLRREKSPKTLPMPKGLSIHKEKEMGEMELRTFPHFPVSFIDRDGTCHNVGQLSDCERKSQKPFFIRLLQLSCRIQHLLMVGRHMKPIFL